MPLDLTKETPSGAYSKGEPYRTISALELLATLISLMVFGDSFAPAGSRAQATVSLTEVGGFTDSQVSTSVAAKLSSTSFPLCAVAMELAAQLEKRQLRLSLECSPREVNHEAADLTNGLCGAFDPSLRIEVDLKSLPWCFLLQVLQEGQEFYAKEKTLRKRAHEEESREAQATGGAAFSRRKTEPLRTREPW